MIFDLTRQKKLIFIVLLLTLYIVIYLCLNHRNDKHSSILCESQLNKHDHHQYMKFKRAENVNHINFNDSTNKCEHQWDEYDYHQYMDFEQFDNVNGSDHFIVPNIVHLVYLGESKFKFSHMISFYSIILNQNPDKIYIHCDVCEFNDRFWSTINGIKCIRERVVFNKIKNYDTIFGVKIHFVEHRADIVRLMVLMTYGGIYLDNDVYVVNSLDKYRKFEMTIGWEEAGKVIGNQLIIANPHARFLKTFYDSYRHNYSPNQWYYNGGIYPAFLLEKNKKLVHLVEAKLNNNFFFLVGTLYEKYYPDWRDMDAIHLQSRHHVHARSLNEISVQWFNHTYGEICRDVLTRIKPYLIESKKYKFPLAHFI